MPILLPIKFQCLDKEAFKELDYKVMGHAFECQRDLDRLCAEGVFQRDLAARLNSAGIVPARIEQPLTVRHGDFETRYEIDLLVADAAVYELKTSAALTSEHEGQLLNYLLLCDQPRGKLINFRPESVESRFVNVSLTEAERYRFGWIDARWRAHSNRCDVFRGILSAILTDWGVFLSTALYVDALTHFLGGEEAVISGVPMSRNGVPLGLQPLHLLTPEVAFRVTALSSQQNHYESNLRRLLALTDLRAIQWVNLNRHDVELVTIERS